MIAVVSAAVVVVAGLYMSRRMTEPIRDFAEDAKRIADGDLDHSIKVSYPTSEMRLMSESACNMKQRLLRALDEAEEAREDAEKARKKYESIFEGSPDAVVLADAETGDILEVNQQTADLFGYSEDQLRGMRQPDLHPDEKRQEYAEAFDSVRNRADGDPVTVTEREDGSPIRIETKEGDLKPVSIRSTNIEVDGRKFAYATFRDISERKQRQRRLEMFRKAVEHAGHAIYITDTDGVIEYVNSEFEEITGYSADEMIGETPRKLKSGEQDDSYYESLWETILSGDVWEEEVVDRRKDGRLYTAHQTIAPITDSDGDPTKFVAIQTDISSRMLRQQRLQVMHRVLRHNLRNGLSVIIGYSEMIDDESQSRGIGEMIRKKASELESLSEKAERVNSLLEVSDDSDSKAGLDEVLTDITQKASLRHEDAEVYWDSDMSEPYTVSMRTKTGIKEIVDNAVEHNDTRDPRVEIDVVECDDEIEVDISDNGPGIPDDEQEVLRNGEETPLKHGSGLGLWLVYWLVKMEGGKIDISERQPRGSTVRVILPKPD
ncbi:MAG: PAS domain S-box protein [Halobacteria archaeon]|nr:PAS domain S-box protein [Halobacteria archaeon]